MLSWSRSFQSVSRVYRRERQTVFSQRSNAATDVTTAAVDACRGTCVCVCVCVRGGFQGTPGRWRTPRPRWVRRPARREVARRCTCACSVRGTPTCATRTTPVTRPEARPPAISRYSPRPSNERALLDATRGTTRRVQSSDISPRARPVDDGPAQLCCLSDYSTLQTYSI